MLHKSIFSHHGHLTNENQKMNTNEKRTTSPFTINCIHVGSKLYEVLVQHARTHPGTPIRYGDLLKGCRERFPDDDIVKRAVPIGIGMKLLFVKSFCDKHDYPNLACLAVNQTGRPGESYEGNWELNMLAVANFDWSNASAQLAIYVAEATVRAKPRSKVSEKDAKQALYENFTLDRSRYEFFDQDDREEMVNLLMDGIEMEEAYLIVTGAKSELGPIA